MYEAENDPYCYRGSTVLKNVPGIHDQLGLERFEAVAVLERALQPLPRGRLSVSHYRAIHRHLFQDVYRWSGQFRTVRVAKGDSMFCYPEHIPGEMRQLFARLADSDCFSRLNANGFASSAAHFLAELNAIHPFREGNGRCQNTFLALLGARAGHSLVLSRLDQEGFLAAMIESFAGREEPLAEQLLLLIDE
jgi:cell filamentation protein